MRGRGVESVFTHYFYSQILLLCFRRERIIIDILGLDVQALHDYNFT